MNDFCKGFLKLPKMPSVSNTFAQTMGIQDLPNLKVFQSGYPDSSARNKAPSSKPSILRSQFSPGAKIKCHSEIFAKMKKLEQSGR